MSKKIEYSQCGLEKTTDNGVLKQVTFIPSKFAKVGSTIKLKKGETWEGGWVVKSVGTKIMEDKLPDLHKSIRGHRKNTGDSLS